MGVLNDIGDEIDKAVDQAEDAVQDATGVDFGGGGSQADVEDTNESESTGVTDNPGKAVSEAAEGVGQAVDQAEDTVQESTGVDVGGSGGGSSDTDTQTIESSVDVEFGGGGGGGSSPTPSSGSPSSTSSKSGRSNSAQKISNQLTQKDKRGLPENQQKVEQAQKFREQNRDKNKRNRNKSKKLTKAGQRFRREKKQLNRLPSFSVTEKSVAGEFTEEAVVGQTIEAGKQIAETAIESPQLVNPAIAQALGRKDIFNSPIEGQPKKQFQEALPELSEAQQRISKNEQLVKGVEQGFRFGTPQGILAGETKKGQKAIETLSKGTLKEIPEKATELPLIVGATARTVDEQQKTKKEIRKGAKEVSGKIDEKPVDFAFTEVAPDAGLDLVTGGGAVITVPEKAQTGAAFAKGKGSLGTRLTGDSFIIEQPLEKAGARNQQFAEKLREKGIGEKRIEDVNVDQTTGKVERRVKDIQPGQNIKTGKVTQGQRIEEQLNRREFAKEKLGLKDKSFNDISLTGSSKGQLNLGGGGNTVVKEEKPSPEVNDVGKDLFGESVQPERPLPEEINLPQPKTVPTVTRVENQELEETLGQDQPQKQNQPPIQDEKIIDQQKPQQETVPKIFEETLPQEQPETLIITEPQLQPRPKTEIDFQPSENQQKQVKNPEKSGEKENQFAPSLIGLLSGKEEKVTEQQAEKLSETSFSGLGVRQDIQIVEDNKNRKTDLEKQLGL